MAAKHRLFLDFMVRGLLTDAFDRQSPYQEGVPEEVEPSPQDPSERQKKFSLRERGKK